MTYKNVECSCLIFSKDVVVDNGSAYLHLVNWKKLI